jgi:hypothetical protein
MGGQKGPNQILIRLQQFWGIDIMIAYSSALIVGMLVAFIGASMGYLLPPNQRDSMT